MFFNSFRAINFALFLLRMVQVDAYADTTANDDWVDYEVIDGDISLSSVSWFMPSVYCESEEEKVEKWLLKMKRRQFRPQ